MLTFLLVSFVAGMLTVLAPCILPVLPVVIGSSALGKSRWTPYVVVASLSLSVIAFTFLLKVSSAFITVPPEVWADISGGIFVLFGLTLLFPTLWDKVPGLARASLSSSKLLGVGYQKKSLFGDIIVGAALGPIFSTCSPTYFLILASVLPASIALGTLYIVAYVVGLAAVLLPLALLGDRLASKLSVLANPRSWFKWILGFLFVLLGLLIMFGIEKKIETAILNTGYLDITKVERLLLQATEPMKDMSLSNPYHELVDPAGFVNAEPFQLKDIVGKRVVLIDFVTYSCINCQRTFPYLNHWYEEYKGQGLEIVAVHTPEFAFEKDSANVRAAAQKFGLKFPLVLDNNYGTWTAYENRYWPRKYLIDINGNIVYDHIGEGGYDETETKIVELLNQRKSVLGEAGTVTKSGDVPKDAVMLDFSKVKTPETYLGGSRLQYLVNIPSRSCLTGSCSYSFTSGTPQGYELQGQWKIEGEYATLEKGTGAIRIAFEANKVNLVAGSDTPVRAEILVDGKLYREVVIQAHELYNLVDLGQEYGSHIMEIRFLDPGVSAFAFTFG